MNIQKGRKKNQLSKKWNKVQSQNIFEQNKWTKGNHVNCYTFEKHMQRETERERVTKNLSDQNPIKLHNTSHYCCKDPWEFASSLNLSFVQPCPRKKMQECKANCYQSTAKTPQKLSLSFRFYFFPFLSLLVSKTWQQAEITAQSRNTNKCSLFGGMID